MEGIVKCGSFLRVGSFSSSYLIRTRSLCETHAHTRTHARNYTPIHTHYPPPPPPPPPHTHVFSKNKSLSSIGFGIVCFQLSLNCSLNDICIIISSCTFFYMNNLNQFLYSHWHWAAECLNKNRKEHKHELATQDYSEKYGYVIIRRKIIIYILYSMIFSITASKNI